MPRTYDVKTCETPAITAITHTVPIADTLKTYRDVCFQLCVFSSKENIILIGYMMLMSRDGLINGDVGIILFEAF